MKTNHIFWTTLLILQGCSTLPSSWNPHKNAATRHSHQEVLKELDAKSHRGPASILEGLNVNFNDLRRIRPGKFEVYVFPKVTAQTSKELLSDEMYLGPPQVFHVSVLAINSCRKFLTEKLFANYKPEDAFPDELGKGNNRNCGILEITDKRLSSIDKALLRKDDQLSVRLFVDDQYRVHAIDHTLFETPNRNRLVRRVSGEEDLTVGLSYFPTELPGPSSVASKAELQRQFAPRLDPIARHQIQQRYSKAFEAPKCEGFILSSKDPLGGNSQVGWCKGLPWPSYSENGRFFSVTQVLKVD